MGHRGCDHAFGGRLGLSTPSNDGLLGQHVVNSLTGDRKIPRSGSD